VLTAIPARSAMASIVAFRSTMTGTHRGPLNFGPFRGLPATGREVAVPHMHFVRMVNGKAYDLWHVWDIAGLMRQLGVIPEGQRRPV
jgi:predicted ester cyclase